MHCFIILFLFQSRCQGVIHHHYKGILFLYFSPGQNASWEAELRKQEGLSSKVTTKEIKNNWVEKGVNVELNWNKPAEGN